MEGLFQVARAVSIDANVRRVQQQERLREQRLAELKELLDTYSLLLRTWDPAVGTPLEWSLSYLRDLARAERDALEPPPPRGGSGQAIAEPLSRTSLPPVDQRLIERTRIF